MHQPIARENDFDQGRQLKSEHKPSTCPWCGSRRIAIVLGGMPVYIPELENDLDSGQSETGNGSNAKNTPSWQCTECGAQFFREPQLLEKKT